MAIECFKILNKLSPSCLYDLVVFKDCKYNFRYSNIVDIPRVQTSTYGKNSFKYAAAVLWNDLPDHFRKISNFNQFKNILKSWNGNVCKCSVCADFKFKFLASRSYSVFSSPGVRRPSSVCKLFQKSSPLKPLGQFKPNLA